MLYLANEDYKLKCYDSSNLEVSLANLSPLCFTVQKSNNMKIDGKSVITGLTILVTTATGSITTSKIDGSAVTFVSASGTLVGSTEKNLVDSLPICLADENATILTLQASKCTKGQLIVVGTNTQSGATITDICNIWFSDAGQTSTKGD